MKTMQLIKAPNPLEQIVPSQPCVFLAGSIEVGKAEKWQDTMVDQLKDEAVTLLNPRRNSWDHTWEQTMENSNFRNQITWELEALERSDIIAMYFDPKAKSPITLLEFGLYARSKKLLVCCPEGFWRKGNVDVVCQHYGVQQLDTLDDLINEVKKNIQ